MFERLDHVGIAVEDLDGALPLYTGALGMELVARETIPEQGVDAALLEHGGERIELLAPLRPETTVGRFLTRRGAGVHHVAYGVDDIDAALAELAGRGVELIDTAPRRGLHASRVAFVHPRASAGVLSEIVEAART
jgi:methylmalonyl-CoA/ethylmalonyl-CoA epimerase